MTLARKYLRGHEDGFEWRGREVSRLEGLVIAAEVGIFGYLGWAVWRTKRLKKRRIAVEARMESESLRGDVGHSLAPTV